METSDDSSSPFNSKGWRDMLELMYPPATLSYSAMLPPVEGIHPNLHVRFDELGLENYTKLWRLEAHASEDAAKNNWTFKDAGGVWLLNVRVLGSWVLVLHCSFCRIALPLSREELSKQVQTASMQIDPKSALNELGATMRHVVLMWKYKNVKGTPTPQPSGIMTPAGDFSDEEVREAFMNMIEGTRGSQSQAKAKALARDGLKCLVTQRWDDYAPQLVGLDKIQQNPVRGDLTATECCHVLPVPTVRNIPPPGDSGRNDPKIQKKLDDTNYLFSILRLFGLGEEVKILQGSNGAHDLSNILTLNHDNHMRFDKLHLWFEPTSNMNEYKVTVLPQFETLYSIPSDPITLINSAAEFGYPLCSDEPLPSRSLLAIHAACARVAHMSGAGEYAEFCGAGQDDAPKIAAHKLAADGSSALLLTEALNRIGVLAH